jgi:hypothetical protein
MTNASRAVKDNEIETCAANGVKEITEVVMETSSEEFPAIAALEESDEDRFETVCAAESHSIIPRNQTASDCNGVWLQI